MATKKASDLKVGDTFGDPGREPYRDGPNRGRLRPATVVRINQTRGRRVHLTLDDHTRWGPWVAS